MGFSDTAVSVIGFIFFNIIAALIVIYYYRTGHKVNPVRQNSKASRKGLIKRERTHLKFKRHTTDERSLNERAAGSYAARTNSYIALSSKISRVTGEYMVPRAMSTLIDKIIDKEE